MTMEAIRGFEFVTFEQANADRQPSHCAMLPFTRNVFDPMDFTPVCLDKLPRGTRRTTAGFELALSAAKQLIELGSPREAIAVCDDAESLCTSDQDSFALVRSE